MALPKRKEEGWLLSPPAIPSYDQLGLADARRRLEEFQGWTAAAVLHLRHEAATLRARGSVGELGLVVAHYSLASRYAFEGRATLNRSVETLRQTVADLRRRGETSDYPDIAAQLFSNANAIEERIQFFQEHVRCHQRLVEAYSELLQVLAGLRDEPRSPWAARVIGPVVGAATLGALLLPSQVGLIAGALLGLAIGLRWRHLDLRPS